MTNIVDLTALRLAKLEARAEAQNYALVRAAQGWELRCPFNARPQFQATNLAEVDHFLANENTT